MIEEPARLVMLLLEATLLGLTKSHVFTQILVPLDSPSDHPDEASRGRRVDTSIGVGPKLVALSRHFLLTLGAKHHDRSVGHAGPIPFDQLERVEFARLMADENRVNSSSRSLASPAALPTTSSRSTSHAVSAANARASHSPVRRLVAIKSTRRREGRPGPTALFRERMGAELMRSPMVTGFSHIG